ncbi:hypothetical protein BBP40_002115 [Aspergillus hancockii]|nr:hypothetical protein BBP40_002115 [Aspergillus hancockii]
MFWIHGGEFQFGSARFDMYDGSSLAAKEDVVIVTNNYRMNVFDFPPSPDIPLSQHNVGFHDQRKALAWTSQNIQAFGVDPTRITIFVQTVATTPHPLPFHAVILQRLAPVLNARVAPMPGPPFTAACEPPRQTISEKSLIAALLSSHQHNADEGAMLSGTIVNSRLLFNQVFSKYPCDNRTTGPASSTQSFHAEDMGELCKMA